MDRILVATDFSTRSDRALRRATLIARRAGASLTLVHIVDSDRSPRLVAAEEATTRSLLDEAADTIRKADGIPADTLVKIGDVDSGIADAAEEARADLVVIGPHRSRLRDVFVGTKVERVIRRIGRPMLVAVQTPSGPYRTTLLALAFDEASKVAARASVKLGIFDRTKVIAFHAFATTGKGLMQRAMIETATIDHHVDAERASSIRQLRELVSELGLPPAGLKVSEYHGSPVRSILEKAAAEDAQLVVMGTTKPSGLERLLIGSVAEDVIRHTSRDILIVPSAGI